MQDKGRGSRPGDLDDALRALSRRAAELESFARSLQADLEAAQEQLAEFVDAEDRAKSQLTRPPLRPEHRRRVDRHERRGADSAPTWRDVSAQRGRIVPLRPPDATKPDSRDRVRPGAIDHREALAAEMRVILRALLRDALGPTAARPPAPPSTPRPGTMLRPPAAGWRTRGLQQRPLTAAKPGPKAMRAPIDAPISATPQTLDLTTEPPVREVLPPAVEEPSSAPAEAAEMPATDDVAVTSVAATEPDDAAVAAISEADGVVSDEPQDAPAAVDPRLLALAEAVTEAAIELPVEQVVNEPTTASSDVETVWASPDAAADVASPAPSVEEPIASVEHVSDPWTIDVPTETVSPTVDESTPAPYVDSPTSLDADAPSNGSPEDVIDASLIDPPAPLEPMPTISVDPPAVGPRGAVRELQVVLSPIGSFPELLRLQARIGSLSSVHTLRLRDFRNGIATFSVGVTEALTGREFGAVLQMFTDLRLRLEGAGESAVELRVDPEAAP